MSALFTQLGWAVFVTLLLFALTWIIAEFMEYLSIGDVVWPLSFPVILLVFILCGRTPMIRWLPLLIMLSLWSVRLAIHLSSRLLFIYPFEDFRFELLRHRWVGRFGYRFFLLFLARGAAALILSLPFLLSLQYPVYMWEPVEVVAMGLWLFAWRGECAADRQLKRFRSDPANKGKACRKGLWRFSRHPNYFFELLMWCAYALYASPAPAGWLAWLSPALMLGILWRGTGVVPVEGRLLRMRPVDYPLYQRETSVFIPWRPRREKKSAIKRLVPEKV